jgi:hypothetical protein
VFSGYKTTFPFVDMLPACGQRLAADRPVLCMDTDLDDRLADVVAGAHRLLDPSFDFPAAIAHYAEAVERSGVARERVYTLDMLLQSGRAD